MGDLFKNMLGAEESLFRNAVALDFDYIPKLIPYREMQQRLIAACIKPLFQKRTGRNAVITGAPGIGKTVACRHLLNELGEETDDVIPIYINCWQKNTSFKIALELCDMLGIRFTQNKKTDELFKIARQVLNKKSAVFVFDEIDKAEDHDFLYSILEEIYRKAVILITNDRDWVAELDQRIKSRLVPEMIHFKAYNYTETKGILEKRMEYAFVPGVWDGKAFDDITKKTTDIADIRAGLFLMRESGNAAEDQSLKRIGERHVKVALEKFDAFSIKSSDSLGDETKSILGMLKRNTGKKIGDVFKAYQENGGKCSYKSFQRKVKKLAEDRFISTEKVTGGSKGSTTIIKAAVEKKLTEF